MSLTAHAPIRNEKAGLGLVLLSERTGIRRETDFIGNYAYRINFDRGTLSFGLSFILSFLRTDLDKLRPDDPNDPLLDRIPEKGMQPDFSTGIYYYTDRFYLSLSAPMFLSHEYDDSQKWRIKNNLNDYNYFANTGYKFDIQKDITMTPSFLVKYFSGTTQVDLGASASFRNKLSIGAIYRSRNILVSMFQVQVNNQLRMGYSYDFILSDRAEYRYNSNEITLRYVFEYLSDVPDPRGF
jgi:type IX secretion system PorP/SprF family membrane protein